MSEKTNERLDELIVKSGLKLGYIADEMGISRQRLYELRINPRTMAIDQMERLSKILNVSFIDIYETSKKF